MVDREFPQVPVEHFDEKFHRRLLAQRANAALVLAVDDLANGQVPMWDGEKWKNVGGFGAWTPTVAFGGASTGVTYSTAQGAYYRLADLVYIYAAVTLTNKGSATGGAQVGGLPLSVADSLAGTALEGMCNVPFIQNVSGTPGAISASILDSDVIAMYVNSGAGSGTLDDADFTNTTSFRLHGLYVTDAA